MIILSIQWQNECFTFVIKPVHSAWPRFGETGTQAVPVSLSVYQLSLSFKGVAERSNVFCMRYRVRRYVLQFQLTRSPCSFPSGLESSPLTPPKMTFHWNLGCCLRLCALCNHLSETRNPNTSGNECCSGAIVLYARKKKRRAYRLQEVGTTRIPDGGSGTVAASALNHSARMSVTLQPSRFLIWDYCTANGLQSSHLTVLHNTTNSSSPFFIPLWRMQSDTDKLPRSLPCSRFFNALFSHIHSKLHRHSMIKARSEERVSE